MWTVPARTLPPWLWSGNALSSSNAASAALIAAPLKRHSFEAKLARAPENCGNWHNNTYVDKFCKQFDDLVDLYNDKVDQILARDENRWIKGLSPQGAEARKKAYKERCNH